MKKFCVVALCALLAISSFGCKDKSRPADLPEDMSPCEITITQDGTPLAGATVDLQYTTNVKYNTSGVTDENGVAIMKTYGYAGAQQGTAKVRVEAEEYGEAGNLGQDFHLVDKKYRSFDTTDLEITIGKENSKEKFDVGAAVHEK